MSKRSAANNLVRRSAENIPPAAPDHLAHLLGAMDGPIDTSDISERTGTPRRIQRNAAGRLPEKRVSPIRQAILKALDRQGMTRYQLWRKAHGYCGTLSQSAVYEYLGGRREIGLPYAEALMQAAGLYVTPRKPTRAKTADRRPAKPKPTKAAAKVSHVPASKKPGRKSSKVPIG